MKAIFDFVETYRAAWEGVMSGREDVGTLTPFFHIPCLMIGADGALNESRSEAEVLAFNVSRRDVFKAGNATIAELRGVDVQSQGQHVALATVNWELKRPDESIDRAWRHYYTIRVIEGSPKILVSTFQTGA